MKIIFIRKKVLYIVIIFVVIFILFFSLINKRYIAITSFLSTGKKVIGIDPGHGGVDPGAIGVSGVREDEINLRIALKLKSLIENDGGIVVITRQDEKGLYTEEAKTLKEKKTEDLINRKRVIEKGKCDLLLSIHLNSFSDSKYYGAQTFYKKDCEESQRLAYNVQEELINTLDKENVRVPQERQEVFLINESDIPAILIECGFLSNPKEEELLKSESYQEKVAQAIYLGVIRYYKELDNKNMKKVLK